jgi:hypothetical protein
MYRELILQYLEQYILGLYVRRQLERPHDTVDHCEVIIAMTRRSALHANKSRIEQRSYDPVSLLVLLVSDSEAHCLTQPSLVSTQRVPTFSRLPTGKNGTVSTASAASTSAT